jgi:hypothetical protein
VKNWFQAFAFKCSLHRRYSVYVAFDVLYRQLMKAGYDVTYCRNFTVGGCTSCMQLTKRLLSNPGT